MMRMRMQCIVLGLVALLGVCGCVGRRPRGQGRCIPSPESEAAGADLRRALRHAVLCANESLPRVAAADGAFHISPRPVDGRNGDYGVFVLTEGTEAHAAYDLLRVGFRERMLHPAAVYLEHRGSPHAEALVLLAVAACDATDISLYPAALRILEDPDSDTLLVMAAMRVFAMEGRRKDLGLVARSGASKDPEVREMSRWVLAVYDLLVAADGARTIERTNLPVSR